MAELCGHDEGSPEEPLSSFGLTSISVAELGAFIRMQFNHQVSALELMTTATCLSLAEAIMQGDQGGDEDDASAAAAGAEHAVAEPPPARRVPSAQREFGSNLLFGGDIDARSESRYWVHVTAARRAAGTRCSAARSVA